MQLSVDGRTVFASTGGKPFDPALPAVVFIHGAAFDATVWKLMTRYFAWHGRSVLAVDLPGHGRSQGPLVDSIPGMADWTMRLLDAAGVGQAALVGHSMGGLVALDAAGRHGDRVRALGLCGTAARVPANDFLPAGSEANDHLALDLVNAWGFGRRAQFGGYRIPGLWMLGYGIRTLEHAASGVLYNDMAACNAYLDGAERAGQVRCPTVVVAGQRDMMTPLKSLRALADSIAGASLVVLPGIGHIMIEEAPDETLDALKGVI